MRKLTPFFFVLLTNLCFNQLQAQVNTPSPPKVYRPLKLDEHSYVRDSTGKRYDYTAWNSMVASGRYGVKVVALPNEKPSLIIGLLNKAERYEAISKMPKPPESAFFKTGEPFVHFKETDIAGQMLDLKQLAGKIVVLNFWSVNNSQCRRQIADLNELADSYKADPNIVFLAVALEGKDEVDEFLKTNTFKYRHLERGKRLNSKYSINMHPADVVIDKAGKIQYHTAGYSPANGYWLGKAIEQAKATL